MEAHQVNAEQKSLITITDSARENIFRLMKREKGHEKAYLRVGIVGGGCSGYSYKLGFADAPKEGDRSFQENGVPVVVDPKSALFLTGLKIDFLDGLNGSGFSYENPKASKSCGCGTSFAV